MIEHDPVTAVATLATMRAGILAATREIGTPTGPGIADAIDFGASRAYSAGMDLLAALQDDNADVIARDLGWQSAADLMAFLSAGPETARRPQ